MAYFKNDTKSKQWQMRLASGAETASVIINMP